MKNKNLELNVDFIGGQGALTPKEEKALSEYFQQKAQKGRKTDISKKTKLAKSKFETV